MFGNSKLSKMRLLLITAALAASVSGLGVTALADDGNVSERDMMVQAVELYEKLNGSEVEVPDALLEACGDKTLGKAVILGFANADELDGISQSVGLRKQDAITVLYKTLIDFDDSFALSSEEVDELMNKCYDNALIDEENRVAYAFFLKYGIVAQNTSTEPDKDITWKGCAVLIDELYNRFVQDVSFDVNGTVVKIGAHIESVTDILGEPSRIDKGDYGFDWYVYNNDYSSFMMVGVDNGRICSFFSNAQKLSFENFKTGESYYEAYYLNEREYYNVFKDDDEKIEGVFYMPYRKSESIAEVTPQVRAFELADMINAHRVSHNMQPLKISQSLTENAQNMAEQPKYVELARDAKYDHEKDGAQHETDFDACNLYLRFIAENCDAVSEENDVIGIGTSVTADYVVEASVIAENSRKANIADSVTATAEALETMAPSAAEADVNNTNEIKENNDTKETNNAAQENTAEEEIQGDLKVVAPVADEVVSADDNLEIQLENSADKEIYVKIYSVEDDEYIVNSFMKSDNDKITIDKSLFTQGKDYEISISDAQSGNEENKLVVSYGEVPENDLQITAFENGAVIDDDYINLTWNSELYHDFIVDVYDEEGKLLLSKTVSDAKYAKISGIEPGKYSISVTAVRRGSTDVIKAETKSDFEIVLPDAVITEYILEDGEEFYPVYEDEELGLVYFYDEDIIDVNSVKKKKITQKQVKATDYYKALSYAQQRIECFKGSETRDLSVDENGISTFKYSGSGLSIYSSETGNAIVAEAEKYLGIPYVWGGTTTNGFDCSGLCQYVYKQLGINISRVSQSQYLEGEHISRENLQPGDLVFFQKNGDVHHVGIYAGDGMMIHAPYTGTVVQYQSIDTPYYSAQFCGGRRIYSGN